jgi:hypothetical protein
LPFDICHFEIEEPQTLSAALFIKWHMRNFKFQISNGKWQMANGKWQMANGKFQMANIQSRFGP